jgi:hypothetical protein
MFTVKDVVFINIRSLTPQQAAGNALAYAVQEYVEDKRNRFS